MKWYIMIGPQNYFYNTNNFTPRTEGSWGVPEIAGNPRTPTIPRIPRVSGILGVVGMEGIKGNGGSPEASLQLGVGSFGLSLGNDT